MMFDRYLISRIKKAVELLVQHSWDDVMPVQYPLISIIGVTVFCLDIIISIGSLYVLAKRYLESRIKTVLVLAHLYAVNIISLLIELSFLTSHFENPGTFYLKPDNLSIQLFSYLGLISGGFYLLFIDHFKTDRLSLVHVTIVSIFLSTYGLFLYSSLVIPGFRLYFPGTHVSFGYISAVFLIIFLIEQIRGLKEIKRLVKNRVQKRQVFLMQSALVFYYLITVFFSVPGKLSSWSFLPEDVQIFLTYVAPRISVMIGNVLIILAFATVKRAFLQVQRLEKLLVMTKFGLPLYTHDFEVNHASTEKSLLLSGGISAVVSLLAETLEATDLKTIQFEEKQILVISKEIFGVFLVVDQATAFLWRALNAFVQMFMDQYELDPQTISMVSVNQFQNASVLVEKAFGL